MFLNGREVLGDCYDRFGNEFPIRFDFLDTFDGGNLSLQCHPRPDYARQHFGENFTQEESYYILDTQDEGVVYLGFRDDIDPEKFRSDLENSERGKIPFDAAEFIQVHSAKKHDLFLIPYGTVHGSGKNNLVLEISSTPYIFTFKMYDWLRPDLSGRQRQLNIKRAMDNLFFERKGSYVSEKLISKPVLIQSGKEWQKWHLPTHETHLYDVHRIHFKTFAVIPTEDKCLVMSLVEGRSITVETERGIRQKFNYAETFVIPAAAGSITVINNADGYAIIVIAFVK
jgi:mannose-6-phosphate isomerase class I